MQLKHSKQREVIYHFLMTREDHPTADVVYTGVRREIPNISLGTVYRNLQLLSEVGQIQKVNVGDGVDHFDADISLHYHFRCRTCGAVRDLKLKPLPFDPKDLVLDFGGQIDATTTYFEGVCADCLANRSEM